jgi:hypothetical protein
LAVLTLFSIFYSFVFEIKLTDENGSDIRYIVFEDPVGNDSPSLLKSSDPKAL